jgi:hypothetical protein
MKKSVLRAYSSYFSAQIMYTKLLDAGIHCFLKDEHSASIYPVLNNAIDGIKLLVFTNDLYKANELVLLFEEEYIETLPCPICNTKSLTSVMSILEKNWIEKLLSKLFSVKEIPTEKSFACKKCNWKDKALPTGNDGLNK